ncbi:MAG TPA: tetratricopeptide repeat protein [Casimicrobiaceae bacterium]|nr:tetratricopeptide repeat protein [Casimicrobiaceae bacterium]
MQITLTEAFARAFAHERAGRKAEARLIYAGILDAIPDHPGALLKLADHDIDAGALDAARARLDSALAVAEKQRLPLGDIWFGYARLRHKGGDRAGAREACERAIAAAPNALAPLRLLGALAFDDGDFVAAQAWCRRALVHHPGEPGLLHLLGRALKGAGATAAAYRVLTDCAAITPDDAGVLTTLGAVCIDAGKPAEARTHLERAVAIGGVDARACDNLGIACWGTRDEDAALAAFERAVAADPTLTPALANLVHTRRYLCEWDGLDAIEAKLIATLEMPDADPRWSPYIALSSSLTPAQELAVARRWSRAVLPVPVSARSAKPRGDRLRVGYLSRDFREHPTGRLMAGLFEETDRSRFDLFAYSYGPEDGSATQQRIRAAFGESWRDVGGLSDFDAAARIRDDGIDLLIERKGHTLGGRLGILASRPAPVQLHYMSFPGTLGYDAVDGIIADDVVVPDGAEAFYHERVWRMPRCYFVNDGRRGLPAATTRRDAGLPDDRLVFACLNQSYKLSPAVFAIWMDVMARMPKVVLWLLASSERMQANLQRLASRAGVDPARLIFAPLVPQNEHIARLACADLAVDTLPYGSHTTGCDALWAGVPLLTCPGETFASRVGASLLRTARLPELIAASLDDYRLLLHELASRPEVLRAHHEFLERTRPDNPLFDTRGFARDWEALLERAYAGTLAAHGSAPST